MDIPNSIRHKIAKNEYKLLMARIYAVKCDVTFRAVTMGCCIYPKYESFYSRKNNFYIDMRNQAVGFAKKQIEKITN